MEGGVIIDAALARWSALLWLGGWWASGGRHRQMTLGWETSRCCIVALPLLLTSRPPSSDDNHPTSGIDGMTTTTRH